MMRDNMSPQLRQSRHAKLVNGERMMGFGARRTCVIPGCGTKLSRYNPSGNCASHAGWQDPRERQHG